MIMIFLTIKIKEYNIVKLSKIEDSVKPKKKSKKKDIMLIDL